MNSHRWIWSALIAAILMASVTDRVSAQVFVAPAPVVSFYAPAAPVVATPVFAQPAVSFYTVPAPVPVTVAPAQVAFFTPAVAVPPPVPAFASVPATAGYFNPVAVPYNFRVSRGLFGRTIVRTPFSVTKF